MRDFHQKLLIQGSYPKSTHQLSFYSQYFYFCGHYSQVRKQKHYQIVNFDIFCSRPDAFSRSGKEHSWKRLLRNALPACNFFSLSLLMLIYFNLQICLNQQILYNTSMRKSQIADSGLSNLSCNNKNTDTTRGSKQPALEWTKYNNIIREQEKFNQQNVNFYGNLSDIIGWYIQKVQRFQGFFDKTEIQIILAGLQSAKLYYLQSAKQGINPNEHEQLRERVKQLLNAEKDKFQQRKLPSYSEVMSCGLFEIVLQNNEVFSDIKERKTIFKTIYQIEYRTSERQKIIYFFHLLLKRLRQLTFDARQDVGQQQIKIAQFVIFQYLSLYLFTLTKYPCYEKLVFSTVVINDSFIKLTTEREGSLNLMKRLARISPKILQQEIQKLEAIITK